MSENNQEPDRTKRESADRLVTFLHVLMRDHLPFGAVEDIVKNHLGQDEVGVYENETTLAHAEFMAKRIRGDS